MNFLIPTISNVLLRTSQCIMKFPIGVVKDLRPSVVRTYFFHNTNQKNYTRIAGGG